MTPSVAAVHVLFEAAALPAAVALAGVGALWIGVLLRRRASARASLALGAAFLLAGSAYLAVILIPQAYEYGELKRHASRARQMLPQATWEDPGLRCPSGEPAGVQLARLFSRHEVMVLRVGWDTFPPRYEVQVDGRVRLPGEDVERRLELTVDVRLDQSAVLRGAWFKGDPAALAAARRLLVDACGRSLRDTIAAEPAAAEKQGSP